MIRTAQCLAAAMLGMRSATAIARILRPVSNLRPLDTFDMMYPKGFEDLYAAGVPAVKAFFQYWKGKHYQDIDALDYWMDIAASEVLEVFNRMSIGEVAVGFNHTAAIELAALRLDPENASDESLKELQGIIFFLHDDGSITTERYDPNVA